MREDKVHLDVAARFCFGVSFLPEVELGEGLAVAMLEQNVERLGEVAWRS